VAPTILRNSRSIPEDRAGESSVVRSTGRIGAIRRIVEPGLPESSCCFATPTIFRNRASQVAALFRKIVGATRE
jgi:hypothetical protein